MTPAESPPAAKPRATVGLFVTCIVDVMRPQIGFAAVRLLERAGYAVVVPQQSCCGQPNFNSGDAKGARAVARATLAAFGGFDYVVVPSGSCGGMIRKHYAELFPVGSKEHAQALALSQKTYELVSFLVDVAGVAAVDATLPGRATYHDSCSGLRELGIKRQPRALLASVEGLELVEMAEPEVCCGFGGAFCVKYPEISNRMVEDKTNDIIATGADYVLLGDLGCLLNIEGKLARLGAKTRALHVAEALAGPLEPDETP